MESWSVKFLNPQWLFCLVFLPFVYGFCFWLQKKRRNHLTLFALSSIWEKIIPELDFQARLRKLVLFLISFCFLLLALARPQFGFKEELLKISGLDILIALDISNSMETEDVSPSRLKKAKHLIRNLLGELSGNRIGLVAFAGSSYVACPLTTDVDYLSDTLNILNPRVIQNQGTNLVSGLETAILALERGKEGGAQSSQISSQVLILITDGEDYEEGTEVFKKIKENKIQFYVLGVGTEKGGPVPIRDENGIIQGYKKTMAGEPAISRFSAVELGQKTELAGGKFWPVSTDEKEVTEILHEIAKEIGTFKHSDFYERRFLVYQEFFQFPLLIGLVLLFLEISTPIRKLLLIFFCIASFHHKANATSFNSYFDNKKGIEAYSSGDFEEAQRRFNSAQAREPDLLELQFNQGVIHLKRGDADLAISALQKVMKGAQEKKDALLYGSAAFNLGNAYAKKDDINNAVSAYMDAIKTAITTNNKKLESDARKNLQLLLNQTKDQKNNENQNEDSKKEQEKKKEKNGNERDSEEKEQNSSIEDKGKQQDKKRQKEFHSEKLKPEDAEQVITDLMDKERQLQEKLQMRSADKAARSKNIKSRKTQNDW